MEEENRINQCFTKEVPILHQRTLRVGITAIVCAAVFRAFAMGIPEKLLARLQQTDPAPFLIYLETGRDVRFSASQAVFSPRFVETPPPAIPEGETDPRPVFTGDETVKLKSFAAVAPDVESLLMRPLSWDLTGREPTVLILHTHSTESYTRSGESYEETAAYRTLDEDYNMVSIGSAVAQKLREAGICVIHSRSIHDYPSYNGSYSAARETIRGYLEEYPTISLVLDLHRDASEGAGGQLRPLADIGGKTAAQIMVVLGTNHEGYEENLSLGVKLHAQLERLYPGITRPTQLRTQRFNQDLLPGALLVEMGAAGNTREEALAAAEILAEAVITLSKGTREAEEFA